MPAQRKSQQQKKPQKKSVPYYRSLAPKRSYRSGKGAYYISGGAYARGKIPYLGNVGAAMNAGYSNGKVSAPTLSGLGAYAISNIKHNVLIKPDVPQMVNARYAEGGTIVRHREYLGPVVTSATAGSFKIESYPLNPAQDVTFPWLSSIASNYEEYKPNGLLFEFRSTASDAIASSTNLALGQIMMCTQYDPTDPEFASDVELLNYSWAQSGKVSDCVQHYVECDPRQSPLAHLYTRQGATTSDSDLRFSDFGRFSIASSGLQGTSVQVGQLWVTYEFIMYKPKLGSAGADPGGWYHYSNDVGISATQPLGTISVGVVDAENNIAVNPVDATNDVNLFLPASFKPTSYMVKIAYIGNSTALVTPPTFGNTTDPSIQFVQHSDNNNSAQIFTPNGYPATSEEATCTTWISVLGDGASHALKLSSGVQPTTAKVDLYISQIPYLDPHLYG
nr:putative capsid protein [Crucivirus sp.]